jgi:hypothetical protein
MSTNEQEGVCYAQPHSLAERLAIARDFVTRNDYRIPMLVDGMDNECDTLYAGWPERLYVIDANGVIAYKGRTGPFGFEPEELDAWLAAH